MGRSSAYVSRQHRFWRRNAAQGTRKGDLLMTQDKYQIRVKGHLGQEWSAWFDGLTISNVERGEAILAGFIVDQAALFGVLLKIRDLGLPLLAVNRVEFYREG